MPAVFNQHVYDCILQLCPDLFCDVSFTYTRTAFRGFPLCKTLSARHPGKTPAFTQPLNDPQNNQQEKNGLPALNQAGALNIGLASITGHQMVQTFSFRKKAITSSSQLFS